MKKFATLLCATILFAACHNSGSSTVGEYDSDQPEHATEHKSGEHHGEAKKEGGKAENAAIDFEGVDVHATADTAHHATADTTKH